MSILRTCLKGAALAGLTWALAMAGTPGIQAGEVVAYPGGSPTVLWTEHDDLGGGESIATGVATLGSKIYVAVCGKGVDGDWYGQLRIYTSSGSLIRAYDTFDLMGGRTSTVAVSGSKAYISGYAGEAGTGAEQVLVRAYDASGKGFKWEYKVGTPYAGLYPIGVAALGSKIVGFANTSASPSGPTTGRLFGLNQKNGALKWSGQFGSANDVASRVNAIAIKGSKFAAAGFNQDDDGYKWFSVGVYSAVNGNRESATGSRMSGPENEALAVAWSGSIVGVAGYLSPGASTRVGWVEAIEISGRGSTVRPIESYSLGYGEDRFAGVAVSGKTIYACGYGLAGPSDQVAYVRAYDSKTAALQWNDQFELTVYGGMVTMGLAVAKSGIYVAGYGLGPFRVTDWFAKGFDSSGGGKWLEEYNFNGGNETIAHGIAVSSSAVIAAGRGRNGPAGPQEMVMRAYAP